MGTCSICNKNTAAGSGNGRFCSIECRFYSKIIKTDFCWNWNAGKTSGRYGSLQCGERNKLAHRISWEIHFGKIPPNLHVCHRCDNGFCVNPDHLFLGTPQDNMDDKAAKGRVKSNPNRKIAISEYANIKKLIEQGKSRVEISNLYKCSNTNIGKIVNKLGIKYNYFSKIKPTEYAKIASLYKEGFSDSDIADIFECTRANISRIIRKEFPYLRTH